jgi:hypothetical protein
LFCKWRSFLLNNKLKEYRMRLKFLAMVLLTAGVASALGGCAPGFKGQGSLSTSSTEIPGSKQKLVAAAGNTGDIFSPTMTTFFLQDQKGNLTPLGTGSGQAPGTAIISAVAGGLSNGAGYGLAGSLVNGAGGGGGGGGGANAGNINIRVKSVGGGATNTVK